jgi:hypothetical protein
VSLGRVAFFVAGFVLISTARLGIAGESPEPVPNGAPAPVIPAPNPYNEARILGVIPDYQTVTESQGHAVPLTSKQKWGLALRETVDPFNIANAFLTAGFSQIGNQTPKYGEGGMAYGERFGAALADFGTQNFFSAGLLASVLHQDPRYFRDAEGHGLVHRILYSVSRVAVTRQDSGATAFNASGIIGMAMGIGASNLYYPSRSIRGSVMAGRIETSLLGSVTGNLMSEFWPDIQKKFFHRKKQ